MVDMNDSYDQATPHLIIIINVKSGDITESEVNLMEDLSMTMVSISIGDVIATLLYLLLVILIISLVFVAFKRLKNSAKKTR